MQMQNVFLEGCKGRSWLCKEGLSSPSLSTSLAINCVLMCFAGESSFSCKSYFSLFFFSSPIKSQGLLLELGPRCSCPLQGQRSAWLLGLCSCGLPSSFLIPTEKNRSQADTGLPLVPPPSKAPHSCLSERNRFVQWNVCLVFLADHGNTPATLPLPENQAVS